MQNYWPPMQLCANIFRSQEVLLKALPPVCMVYTTRVESQVANIAKYNKHDLYSICLLSYTHLWHYTGGAFGETSSYISCPLLFIDCTY